MSASTVLRVWAIAALTLSIVMALMSMFMFAGPDPFQGMGFTLFVAGIVLGRVPSALKKVTNERTRT